MTLVIETYREDIITSGYEFSKITREDLEVLYDTFKNLKKLYNDYLAQEGDNPSIELNTPERSSSSTRCYTK